MIHAVRRKANRKKASLAEVTPFPIVRVLFSDDARDVFLEYSSKFAFLKLPFSVSIHSCLL